MTRYRNSLVQNNNAGILLNRMTSSSASGNLFIYRNRLVGLHLFTTAFLFGISAHAQQLPGPADSGRVDPLPAVNPPDRTAADPITLPAVPDTAIPEAAHQVNFQLHALHIEGATAFTEEKLLAIYAPYIGKQVTLDVVWIIAAKITEYYRHEGYFLSRAYVPAQEIDDGTVTIRVIEGYISHVDLNHPSSDDAVVKELIDRLTLQKPLRTGDLETFMLQMNDLPGIDYRGLLAPAEDAEESAVSLSLEVVEEKSETSVSLDNFGSRFLGPYQGLVTHSNSFLPLQRTIFTALTSLPTDELNYGGFRHEIPLLSDLKLNVQGSFTHAEPGATLEENDIESQSVELGVGLTYQLIRQRQENMELSFSLDGKNTKSDILGDNPLTRDHIRAFRAAVNYDSSDTWNGYNFLHVVLNQGLPFLNASSENDLNLSRAEAEPDFTSVNLLYNRHQFISEDWLIVGQLSGQLASAPLYSAEEFGFGGQQFGKAFDPSEITGDHGIAAALEVRYSDISLGSIQTTPYLFYDTGKVWNMDTDGESISASSAGLGLRFDHAIGIHADIGLAWPLTYNSETPIYGDDGDPRILMQLRYDF